MTPWEELDPEVQQTYLADAGGDLAKAQDLYYGWGEGQPHYPGGQSSGDTSGISTGGQSSAPPPSSSAALHAGETAPAGGSMGGNSLQAPPPVSAPPQPGTGTAPAAAPTTSGGYSSGGYTSGGGSGGSAQAMPQMGGGGGSAWSRALHESGATGDARQLQNPGTVWQSAPGGGDRFNPYVRNASGAGAPAPAQSSAPPVSAPPMPGMSSMPQTPAFDSGAAAFPKPAMNPAAGGYGNQQGSPAAPAPAMTEEELRLRLGQMNTSMRGQYGGF